MVPGARLERASRSFKGWCRCRWTNRDGSSRRSESNALAAGYGPALVPNVVAGCGLPHWPSRAESNRVARRSERRRQIRWREGWQPRKELNLREPGFVDRAPDPPAGLWRRVRESNPPWWRECSGAANAGAGRRAPESNRSFAVLQTAPHTSAARQRGADNGNRTHLGLVGNEMPHQSASSARCALTDSSRHLSVGSRACRR